jgi:mono/diheme cytochrome c family protein
MKLIKFLFLLSWIAVGLAHAQTNPYAERLSQAAKNGEELFGRNCQQCHNSRGKGGKAPQLVKGVWGPGGANSDAYMYQVIITGRPNTAMGSFKGSLSDDEIWQVISFLREEALRVKAAEAKNKDTYVPW